MGDVGNASPWMLTLLTVPVILAFGTITGAFSITNGICLLTNSAESLAATRAPLILMVFLFWPILGLGHCSPHPPTDYICIG